jgi:hypothetical protein
MRSELNHPAARHRWVLTCVGLSIVLGIVFSQAFDFDNPAKFHFVSITGRGSVMDIYLITTAMLLIIGGIEVTAVAGSGSLIIGGTALVFLGLAGPRVISHISPDMKIDPSAHSSILILSTLLFLGAVFLGSGLQRLFGGKKSEPTRSDEGSNDE